MTVGQGKLQRISRPPLLAQGASSALVAGLLVLAGLAGPALLLAAVAVVQVVLLLGFLALAEAPAAGGIFVLGLTSTVAADLVVVTQDGRVGGLAGVVALSLVAGLLHQLARRHRAQVTESLADTMLAVVLACCAACLVATRHLDGGGRALSVALAGAGAALLAGRTGDALSRRTALVAGATRGWLGLLLSLGAGTAAAAAAGGDRVAGWPAALLGLAAATVVACADVAVDLAAASLRPGLPAARRVAALRPVALLLPLAVLGPVTLVASRLVLA